MIRPEPTANFIEDTLRKISSSLVRDFFEMAALRGLDKKKIEVFVNRTREKLLLNTQKNIEKSYKEELANKIVWDFFFDETMSNLIAGVPLLALGIKATCDMLEIVVIFDPLANEVIKSWTGGGITVNGKFFKLNKIYGDVLFNEMPEFYTEKVANIRVLGNPLLSLSYVILRKGRAVIPGELCQRLDFLLKEALLLTEDFAPATLVKI